MANVRTTFTSDDADVQKALSKMMAQMERLRQAQQKASKQSRSASQAQINAWKAQNKLLKIQQQEAEETRKKVEGIAKASAGIAAGFIAGLDALRELRKAQADRQFTLDEQTGRLAVQLGIDRDQATKEIRGIMETAQRLAIPQDVAARAAVELGSQGFAVDGSVQGAFDEFAKVLRASNKAFEDPEGQIRGTAAFLTAAGLDKDADSIRKFGRAASNLFQETSLQVSDLQFFGRAAGDARVAGVSNEESLAAFTVLKNALGEPTVAATGLAQVLRRLGTATEKKQVEALTGAGLTPDDLNPVIQGGLQKSLENLKTGLEKVDAKDQAQFLKDIFGEEAAKSANALLANTGDITRFQGIAQRDETFQKRLEVGTQGVAAARVRLDLQSAIQELDSNFKAARMELESEMLERRFDRRLSDMSTSDSVAQKALAGVLGFATQIAPPLKGGAMEIARMTGGAESEARNLETGFSDTVDPESGVRTVKSTAGTLRIGAPGMSVDELQSIGQQQVEILENIDAKLDNQNRARVAAGALKNAGE